MRLKRVVELIEGAHKCGSTYPSIDLVTEEGQTVRIYRAGRKAGGGRYEGHVQITDGQPFESSTYFGRIDLTGELIASRSMSDDVEDILAAFAEVPERFIGAWGLDEVRCWFCHRSLTDPVSRAVGYGPTCAEKNGLPHEMPEVPLTTFEVVEPEEVEGPDDPFGSLATPIDLPAGQSLAERIVEAVNSSASKKDAVEMVESLLAAR